ncbi:MAG: aminoacyl-tRNA hydrolase [Chrysothrix sp. TS-e1954]|nr:MAG: aminoacyl-tRNA hydrolase [Chrysothrix sp. TS-e1954]
MPVHPLARCTIARPSLRIASNVRFSIGSQARYASNLTRPLLLCSIGNPPATYKNTLHSAGHLLLNAICSNLSLPPLSPAGKGAQSTRDYGASGAPLQLWQSGSLMNISGPGVAAAFRAFVKENSFAGDEGHGEPELVVLHDSLEYDMGVARISKGAGRSAKGHNGLKSILEQPGMKTQDFTRVAVGIGPRVESRQSKDVAEFVLRRMDEKERRTVEGVAGDVWDVLEKGVGQAVTVGRSR